MTRTAPPNWPRPLVFSTPTDEQAAVIAAPPGPLVVIAGAGAGKTETMAARVVWLVANGYAEPGQVLGLTFTRKAAGQLLRRVRSRLARLAGHRSAPDAGGAATPTVSTYHAFAGTLLREYGLLLPVEPDTRLLSETEMWQLAFRRGPRAPRPAGHRQDPASGHRDGAAAGRASSPSTSSTPTSCATPTSNSSGSCTRCPPAATSATAVPASGCCDMLATQTERTVLVPLIDALHARMRDREGDGLRHRRWRRPPGWRRRCPQVGEQLRQPLPGGAARRVPGHRARPADRAVVAVRRRRRRRSGADRGRRPDPVDLRLARRVGDQPAPVHHRLPAGRRQPRRRRSSCAPAGATRRGRCTWPTRCPPRPGGARSRCAPLRSRPGAEPGTVRCALLADVEAERDWVADHIAAALPRGRRRGRPAADGRGAGAAQRRRRADGRGADARAASRSRWSGWPGCCPIPEVADVVAMLRLVADPDRGRGGDAGADRAALAAGCPRHRRAVAPRGHPRRSGGRAAATAEQIVAAGGSRRRHRDAWPTRSAIPVRPPPTPHDGYRRITALGRELAAAASTSGQPGARPGRRGAASARSRRRGARGPAGRRRLDRGRAPRRVRRRRRRLRRTGPARPSTGCWPTWTPRRSSRTGSRLPTSPSRRTGCRSSPCTRPRAWSGRWWPCRTCRARVFPSTASKRTWLTDAADLPPLLRGDRAAGGLHGVPVLDTSSVNDRKGLSDSIIAHRDQLEQRRIDEERRLLYVAITRAEDTLLMSGHHWGATESKPRGPSDFLCELKDIIDSAAAAGRPCGEVEHWAPVPADGEPNPLRDSVRRSDLAGRSAGPAAAPTSSGERLWLPRRRPARCRRRGEDPDGWAADVDALLAERSRTAQPPPRRLPAQLSVSALVELDRDPATAAQAADPAAAVTPRPACDAGHRLSRLGAAVLRRRTALRPRRPARARSTTARPRPSELAELQDAFAASPWAARTPDRRGGARSRW